MKMENLKCVVVGNSTVGKTSLLISITSNTFREDYIPKMFENYSINILVDKKLVSMTLWDTIGQDGEHYDRLRQLSYPQADIFCICFSVDNRRSLENVTAKRRPEIKLFCPDVPVILVACKIDLRSTYSDDERIITYEEGAETANQIGLTYCETSAKTSEGVFDCFKHAIHLVHGTNESNCQCRWCKRHYRKGKKCRII